jgi:hypothetical protein
MRFFLVGGTQRVGVCDGCVLAWDKTGTGHSGEGKLLLGRASRNCAKGSGSAGRS